MTQQQFARLKKKEQISAIKKAGSFLCIRHEAGIDIMLYQIEGFYAEVFYDSASNHIRIRSFADTAPLDIYLKEISIAGLYHLF